MKLWQTGPQGPDPRVEAFTSGQDAQLDQQLLYYDLCGTLAHAEGLRQIGLLDEAQLARLQGALRELWARGLKVHPADEDVHTAVENALTAALGELGQAIHAGRSRNDQVLADLRLLTKERLIEIALLSSELAGALLTFAREHEAVPLPGTSHTRWAMPASLGLWAASFVEGLWEGLAPLEATYGLVNRCPLGAAAGYGVPLPLARGFVAELLGFSEPQLNPLNAISGRGRLDFLALSALGGIMLELGRLSTDLIWSSSEAFGFFTLPDAFCTGSSIMPHKRNPDVLELVRARATRLQAQATQAFSLTQGNISGYHRDHQELKPLLLDGLKTARACLAVLAPLVKDLKVNEPALRAALTPELFAVDAMIEQVKAGVPLRQAYHKVKKNLGRLTLPDLEAALAARAHAGGAGNLGLDRLAQRWAREEEKWTERQRRFRERLGALVPR